MIKISLKRTTNYLHLKYNYSNYATFLIKQKKSRLLS